MINLILSLIGEKNIWKWLIARNNIVNTGFPIDNRIIKEAFTRTPEIYSWIKDREILLLRSLASMPNDMDFIKGQMAELKFISKFGENIPKVEKVEEEIVKKVKITKEAFLKAHK